MSSLLFPTTLPGLSIKLEREPDYDVREHISLSRKRLSYTYETYPLTNYRLSFQVLRSDSAVTLRARELQQVLGHIARHYGSLDSFLLTDPADSSVSDHGFAVGDGATTAFQLQRTLQGDIIDAYGEWPASSKPRTNLLLRSQDWTNAAWTTQTGGTGVTPVRQANVFVAPDGTPTASRVRLDRGSGTTSADISRAYQPSIPVLPITQYMYSVWLRTVDGLTQQVEIETFAGSKSIVAVTGVWQRFTVSGSSAAVTTQNGAMLTSIGTDSTSSQVMDVYIWGGQFELGAVATQYIATTSATVTVNPSYWPGYADGFEPIFDLNGPATFTVEADGLAKRSLVQWSRTNLALQSQTFDNASWTKAANASITADATAAPDGTTTADKLIENSTTSSEHYAEQVVAVAASLTLANVVYAKASERTWVYVSMMLRDNATVAGAYFDLTGGVLGTVETGITATITPCQRPDGSANGTGWYRCAIVGNVGTGGSNPRIRIQLASANGTKSYAGTVNSGLFVWGGQAEQAFQSGDYIPTTTATVARTDLTLSSTGGITAAVAPRSAAQLAWSGSFFRRVRFAEQSLPVEQIVSQMWAAKSISLQSVKP